MKLDNRISSCIFLALSVAVNFGCSSSRPLTCLYTESEIRSILPDFSYDTFYYPTDNEPRVELFLQVGYFVLNFVKEAPARGRRATESGYSARFTVSVLFRAGEEGVNSETWTENVRVASFEETQARSYSVSRRVFQMQPGSYRLSIEVLDENSGRKMQKAKTVVVPNFGTKGLAVSSLTVGTRRIQDGKYVLPTVSQEIVDGRDTVFAQCEVKTATIHQRLRVTYRLTSYRYKMPLQTRPDLLAEFSRPIYREDSSTVAIDTVVSVPNRHLVLQQSFGNVREAHYRLSVLVRPADTSTVSEGSESEVQAHQRRMRLRDAPLPQIALTTKTYTVRSLGFPEVVSTEDQITPLVYIASESEYRSLREASTAVEKRRRLEEFWSNHVGRDVYYERVEHANRYFTCRTQGWRTFPGYIYIVVGPPDAVECLPGVERWFYASPALEISFRSRSEFGGERECRFTYGSIGPYVLDRYLIQWRKQ